MQWEQRRCWPEALVVGVVDLIAATVAAFDLKHTFMPTGGSGISLGDAVAGGPWPERGSDNLWKAKFDIWVAASRIAQIGQIIDQNGVVAFANEPILSGESRQ